MSYSFELDSKVILSNHCFIYILCLRACQTVTVMRSQCCGAEFAMVVYIQCLLYTSILVQAKTTGNLIKINTFTIAKNTLKNVIKWHSQRMMKCDKYYRALGEYNEGWEMSCMSACTSLH